MEMYSQPASTEYGGGISLESSDAKGSILLIALLPL